MHLNEKQQIVLGDREYDNYINIQQCDFRIEYLDTGVPQNSIFPNGYIFKLYDLQNEVVSHAIKFCKIYEPCNISRLRPKITRFEREIKALKIARDSKMNQYVVQIQDDGKHEIDGKSFRYYTMELAEEDLFYFLKKNTLSLQQKYLLCSEMLRCIEALHKIGIYHRDIKPGNFLMFGNNWKIADLGLVDFRENDEAAIDGKKEKIGPRGFLSPEAVNKWLSLSDTPTVIDGKSDVFQLAKVMGYVLQGEVLTGQIATCDLLNVDDSGRLFNVMSKALQYSKARRCDINQFRDEFIDNFGHAYALV